MKVTLLNRSMNSSMRVDLEPGGSMADLVDAAYDVWGDGLVFRDGYDLLSPDDPVNRICEGDLVEVLPDPFISNRWNEVAFRSASAGSI